MAQVVIINNYNLLTNSLVTYYTRNMYKYKGTIKGILTDISRRILDGCVWGFFKKPEYCLCNSSYLTTYEDDQDDDQNFNHLKFSGFNLEFMNKVGMDMSNLLPKNLQLQHLYDYNRLILDIIVENVTTTGIIIPLIVILVCVIAIVTIPLVLCMLPWWRVNGYPVMPGPYMGLPGPFWKNSPKPRPMEPPVQPSGPSPVLPLKDPGKPAEKPPVKNPVDVKGKGKLPIRGNPGKLAEKK